jgi:hypothetical protein
VEKSQISALKLKRAEAKDILLEKGEGWRIVQPLKTRADQSAVAGLLSGLQSLKIERQVVDSAQDLQPYGLDKPQLHLAFLAADIWHHLRIGVKTQIGNNFYASGDEERRVLLITSSSQQSFNKSLIDLRSKELFTIRSNEVDHIDIDRPKGNMALSRLDEKRWQAPAAPKLQVKSLKVESLLNQLVWLRADRFLEDEEAHGAQLGLDPPRIRVQLTGNNTAETLLLGNTTENKGVYARMAESSDLVVVAVDVLGKLPKELTDLEDRTLFVFEPEQVSALALELDDATTKLERHGDTWKRAAAGQQKNPETWEIKSLFWKVQELEHQAGPPPEGESLPENRQLHLILFGSDNQEIGSLLLGEIPTAEQEMGVFWFSEGGEKKRPYWGGGEALRGIYQSMKNLLAPEET